MKELRIEYKRQIDQLVKIMKSNPEYEMWYGITGATGIISIVDRVNDMVFPKDIFELEFKNIDVTKKVFDITMELIKL